MERLRAKRSEPTNFCNKGASGCAQWLHARSPDLHTPPSGNTHISHRLSIQPRVVACRLLAAASARECEKEHSRARVRSLRTAVEFSPRTPFHPNLPAAVRVFSQSQINTVSASASFSYSD